MGQSLAQIFNHLNFKMLIINKKFTSIFYKIAYTSIFYKFAYTSIFYKFALNLILSTGRNSGHWFYPLFKNIGLLSLHSSLKNMFKFLLCKAMLILKNILLLI